MDFLPIAKAARMEAEWENFYPRVFNAEFDPAEVRWRADFACNFWHNNYGPFAKLLRDIRASVELDQSTA